MQQYKVEFKKTIVKESHDNWIQKNEVDETKTQPQSILRALKTNARMKKKQPKLSIKK
jgi:hypothetical protein